MKPKRSHQWVATGLILIALGVVIVFAPLPASLTIKGLVGAGLIGSGVALL